MKAEKSTPKKSFLSPLKKCPEAGKVAMFYGFAPIANPKIIKADFDGTKDLEKEWRPEYKAALLREFHNPINRGLPQPLMVWSGETKSAHRIECSLSIINSSRSISEAMLIQTARAILENAGHRNTIVRINSVGNKDSIAEFERKTSAFLRKKMEEFPAELRVHLKRDIFFLAKSRDEKYKMWKDLAPQTMDSLNEDSRVHFKEILEFLEYLDIPYVVDSSLLGDLNFVSETVFEIVNEEEEILARGARYNRLARKLQYKKEIGAADIFISAKALRAQKMSAIKEVKPKFYLIQFGPEAKLKSLIVLEKLRRSGVLVYHSIIKDKLTGQMSGAENMNIPYILLLGQKEALENSVVLRNTYTRSQITVSISTVGEYIKQNIKTL